MSNKLDIPVYIITLNNKSYYDFNKYFSNVNYFKAVDARKQTAQKYYDDGIISKRVLYDLQRGRKDHFAFSGIGGIGLILSYKKLINQLLDTKQNVLICEEDCNIDNILDFKRKVDLLKNQDFDCAIFGAHVWEKNNVNKQISQSNNIINAYSLPEKLKNDFNLLNSGFIFMHSVIWSPEGIKKINIYLDQLIEFQIDAFLSFLSEDNKLNVLIEKNNSTSQFLHMSTLGNDKDCKLCNYDAKSNKYATSIYDHINFYVILGIVTILIITIIIKINVKCP